MTAEAPLSTINGRILSIADEEQARRFLHDYVAFLEGEGEPHDIAVEIARSEVAWCFAEGMTRQQRAMWERVIHLGRPQSLAAAVG
ncbi:MAG: hypothetical protein F9K40_10900 [Kofleriaceae bacterium]|nr:MAG: hypothetical protein F9K40_10900 [Kofleriaceae bacterium]MBZ0236957.1 hypothetical protein [Kofleriaceae bacterium]